MMIGYFIVDHSVGAGNQSEGVSPHWRCITGGASQMQEFIYYPGFEVRDVNWLKFALLYLDKLDPIIPESGDEHLTEQYRRIMSETDLIEVHRPSLDEGLQA